MGDRLIAVEIVPGGRYGRYRLEDRLGSGGLAEVWRATDFSNGRVVALKRFTGALASADAERLRAELELLAAHALHGHANVVDVLGGGAEPEPHVVMEYLDGGDLGREIARAGRLSIERTLEAGIAVANALSAAADAGVVHGDVKPSNVLLGSDGAIKLADFNVARVTGYSGGSVPGSMLVSFAYAAPEVWEGRVNSASDLYALGCVLYECLTGHPPFTGSYAAVFRAHMESPPDLSALSADTPAALSGLIAELLEKDPARRPADAHSVAVRLADMRTGMTPVQTSELWPTFGPWSIEAPHPVTPWAWFARHRQSGRVATVELFFGDQALGEQLRHAVEQNHRLVPLGAESLIETNRLLLRPDQSLGQPTPPGWIFWVARDEQAALEAPTRLDGPELATAVDRVRRLIVAAQSAGLALDLSPANLVVYPDGRIHLRRPGIARVSVPEDANALATLRQSVVPGLVPVVARAGSLGQLADELSRGATSWGPWGTPQTAPAATVMGSQAPTVPLLRAAGVGAAAATETIRAPFFGANRGAPMTHPGAPAGIPTSPPPPGMGTRLAQRPEKGDNSRLAGIAAALLLVLALLVLGGIAFILTGGLGNRPNPAATVLVGAAPDASPSPTTVLLTPAPVFTPEPLVTAPPIYTPLPILTPLPTPELLLPTAEPPVIAPVTPVPPVVRTPRPPPPPPPPAEATPVPATPVPTRRPAPTPVPTRRPAPTRPPATNPPATPPPPAWGVSLSASDTQADNGELVTFRATASDSVTGTGYVIQIVNPDTGFVHRQCATGTTCSVGGRRENTTARYQALVARPDGSDVQARSRIRTVTWSGGSSGGSSGSAWDVDLSTSDQTASNGEFVRITARSSRDVGGTGYAIQVFNPETGFIHWSCSSGTTCGGRASRQNTTAPYRARISAPNGSDVQAQSDTQTVTWQ